MHAQIELAPTPPGVKSCTKLGEGCVWDSAHSRLLWIDIVKGKIFAYDPVARSLTFCDTRQPIGTVVPHTKHTVCAALCSGMAIVNLASGRIERFLGNPEAHLPENLWNDGKCDPHGRLWVGSKEIFCERPTGALWSYDGVRDNWSRHLTGVGVSNGLVWSKSGTTFWYIDSPTKRIDAFDYDGASGAISNRRCAVQFGESDGYPDGCTIDADDKIWVAMWAGGEVVRVDPRTGAILTRVPVPKVSQVTACAFGGAHLDQLFVTTASCGVPANELKPDGPQCNAGALFRIDLSGTGIRGVTAPALVLGPAPAGDEDRRRVPVGTGLLAAAVALGVALGITMAGARGRP